MDQDDIDRVLFAYGTCEGDPGYDPGANVSTDSTCGSNPALQTVNQDDIDVILYLYGLQAANTLRAKLTWDAENRLTGWEPLAFVPGARKVQFGYDFQGRRVEKRVYVYDGGDWTLHETRRFVYWGWLPLLELDGSNTVVKQFTWGLDLAQSLGAAGGIGGLLACRDPNDPADARLRYHINGAQYLDERVATFEDGGGQFRYYVLGDRFSVVGAGNASGSSIAGLRFGALGDFVCQAPCNYCEHPQTCPGDADGDGCVTQDDLDIVLFTYGTSLGQPGYSGCADFDCDGDVDQDDLDSVLFYLYSCCPWDCEPSQGQFALHGRPVDVLPDGKALLYVRARYYDPENGRWLQRDPAGYVDGANLYESFRGNANRFTDPTGLWDVPGTLAAFRNQNRDTPELLGLLDYLLASGYSLEKGHGWFSWRWIGGRGSRLKRHRGGRFRTSEITSLTTGTFARPLLREAQAGHSFLDTGRVIVVQARDVGSRFVGRPVQGRAGLARRWTSTDPLVGDLANEIEALYPGHVRGVGVVLVDSTGRALTDADILLGNAVIQVKAGTRAGGVVLQLQRSEMATGLPSIAYGPNLRFGSLQALLQQGALITQDKALLLEVIRP